MKKITAFVISLAVVFATLLLPVSAITAAEVENASKPAIELSCSEPDADGLVRVEVRFSGCMGLESADLRFHYDSKNVSFLGATLLGAAAADENLLVSISDMNTAKAVSFAAVSLAHVDSFSVQEGNGAFCELAFRINAGGSKIRAEAVSFMLNGESVQPAEGSCRCSAGAGAFFKEYGSALFVAAVIAVILIVLLVLLVIVRKLKKNAAGNENAVALFEETAPTEADLPEEPASKQETTSEEGDSAENTNPEAPVPQEDSAEEESAKGEDTE